MNSPRGLYERLRAIINEVVKFGAVGAVGVVVNIVVFNLCLRSFHLQSVRSGVIATAVAICTNYLGNRYWTYRNRDKSQQTREVTLFLLFSGIGLVIENGTLALSHYGFGFTSPLADNVAKNFVGLGVATLFRFWSYRTWVFRSRPAQDAVEEAERRPGTGPRPGGAGALSARTGEPPAAGARTPGTRKADGARAAAEAVAARRNGGRLNGERFDGERRASARRR